MARNPGKLVKTKSGKYAVIYNRDIPSKLGPETKLPAYVLETRKDEKGEYPGNPTGEKVLVTVVNSCVIGMVD